MRYLVLNAAAVCFKKAQRLAERYMDVDVDGCVFFLLLLRFMPLARFVVSRAFLGFVVFVVANGRGIFF